MAIVVDPLSFDIFLVSFILKSKDGILLATTQIISDFCRGLFTTIAVAPSWCLMTFLFPCLLPRLNCFYCGLKFEAKLLLVLLPSNLILLCLSIVLLPRQLRYYLVATCIGFVRFFLVALVDLCLSN